MLYYKAIADIIDKINSQEPGKIKALLESIKDDHRLSWHFIHNLKNAETFDMIEDFINYIGTSSNDLLKIKLLEYFAKCVETKSDQIIIHLLTFSQNIWNEFLLRQIAIFLEKLRITDKGSPALYELLERLYSTDYDLVKEFAIDWLHILISTHYDPKAIQELFQKMVKVEFAILKKDMEQKNNIKAKSYNKTSIKALSSFSAMLISDIYYAESSIKDIMFFVDTIFSSDSDSFEGIRDTSMRWLPDTLPEDPKSIKYESDILKKVALDLRYGLSNLYNNNRDVFNVVATLVLKGKDLLYFVIIRNIISSDIAENHDIAKLIIFNPELWEAAYLLEGEWIDFFSGYWKAFSGEVEVFIDAVDAYTEQHNKKHEQYTKANLLFSLPKEKQPKDYKPTRDLERYERKKPRAYTYAGVKKDSVDQDASVPAIIKQCEELTKKGDTLRSISDSIHNYVLAAPESTFPLITWLKGKPETEVVIWRIVWAYIETLKATLEWQREQIYNKLLELYSTLDKEHSYAKVTIGRLLNENEFLRDSSTATLAASNPQLFKDLKNLIMDMASDEDPKPNTEKEIKATDWIHIWLNSVRWSGGVLLSILAFYYPDDKSIYDKLEELVNDEDIWIQAATIYYIRTLIHKNLEFSKRVIRKFEDVRIPAIDMSLLYYIGSFWWERFLENIELLKKLMQSTDDDIQTNLWHLIGSAYLGWIDWLKELLNDILKWNSSNQLISALIFERRSKTPALLDKKEEKLDEIMAYFNELIHYKGNETPDPYHTFPYQASYFFMNDDLNTDHFEIIRAYWIIESILTTAIPTAYKNLNEYLVRVIKKDFSKIKIIFDIIRKESQNGVWGILMDQYLSQEVVEILKLAMTQGLSGEIKEQRNNIFDVWLSYWITWFYEIFNDKQRLEEKKI